MAQRSEKELKIYLDDERSTPDGWVRAYWPDEVIKFLETGKVTHLSLDNDLGDDKRGQGKDVIQWIEEKVALENFKPPEIFVHSANIVAKKQMLQGIEAIKKLAEKNKNVE